MSAWLIQHLRAMALTARRLADAPLAQLFHVLVIGVALALPVLLHLAVQNLQRVGGNAQADARISLYLASDATGRDADQIATRLKAHAGVAGHRFVSREEALKELRQRHDIGDLVDALPKNPLPDAFVVRAASLRAADIEALRKEAAGWPKVALAQLDSAWAARLDSLLGLTRRLALGLAALLSLAVLAVTFNTIGLQVASRREEIEVSRLIGATRGFIRRPFLYLGTLQGVAGGLLAGLLAALCVLAINRQLPALAELYGAEFSARGLSTPELAAIAAFSALLGWLGAWLAVTRHLNVLDRQ
jgi:cell division transport system permease protein